MREELQFLQAVVEQLEALSIPYMLVGSVASSHHGRPRATDDVDVVIDPAPTALEALVGRLQEMDLYVDADRARDALHRRRQFNVLDSRRGFKLDLIVCKARAFSREELGRRSPVELLPGVAFAVASPEDTIVSKLEWARKAGEPEKQLLDAAGVLAANPGLDRAYVCRWAAELGVLDLWQRISSTGSDPS